MNQFHVNLSAFVGFDENCGKDDDRSAIRTCAWSSSSISPRFLVGVRRLDENLCLPARGLELEFELVLLRASIDTDLSWVMI